MLLCTCLCGPVWLVGDDRPLALKGGDFKQVGGEFLFENGECTWAHRMKTTRGHAEVSEIRNLIGLDSTRPPARRRWSHDVKGEEKIQYWGFSYGTYLGLTYAAMFPDKIHRLVVDGVVDAYDYRQTLWFDNLVDTEKDLGLFYYHCARVGYPTCAIANETGETTEAGVKARFVNITQSLLHNPLPVIQRGSPEVITYSDIKNLVFAALYSPVQAFPFVANMLGEIEKGSPIFLADFLLDYFKFDCPQCNSNSNSNTISPTDSGQLRNKTNNGISMSPDATFAIACWKAVRR